MCFGYKLRLNTILSSVRSYTGTESEGPHCPEAQVIRAKCNKWKKSVSLENTNYVETIVVHINANKIKVMYNFCYGAFVS